MSRFTFDEVVAATGAAPRNGERHARLVLSGVTTDSRDVRRGQLFIAISGPNHDGNLFAQRAAQAGAGAVLVGDAAVLLSLPESVPALVHQDTRRALADLGAWHRSRLECPVLAITGSVGKTSTKNIAAALLAKAGPTVAAPKSFNNAIGVPHTLLLADERTEAVVLELGTSGPGEIAALARIARPNVGVITLIGHGHLEKLGSLDGVCTEKGALGAALTHDDKLVLNADDPFCDRLRAMTRAEVRTFSVDGRGDYCATGICSTNTGTRFEWRGRRIDIPLVGMHHVQNVLAAIAAVDAMGFEVDALLGALSELQGAPHRMQRIAVGGLVFVDDCYNSNPDSARAAVRALASLDSAGRRVMVVGDMLELGALAAEHHHQLGMEVARARFELVVCVGDLGRAIAAGALQGGQDPSAVVHYTDTLEAAASLGDLLRTGDTVLFKASRGLAMERIVERLASDLHKEVHHGG